MSFDYGTPVDYWSPIRDFANDGSKKGAKVFCGLIAYHLESDKPLPPEIKQFLAKAFRDAQNGKNLDQSFGLTGHQGVSEDPMEVWGRYERIHGWVQLLIDQGRARQAAYREVADHIAANWPDKYGYDENSVGRIYRKTAERKKKWAESAERVAQIAKRDDEAGG